MDLKPDLHGWSPIPALKRVVIGVLTTTAPYLLTVLPTTEPINWRMVTYLIIGGVLSGLGIDIHALSSANKAK